MSQNPAPGRPRPDTRVRIEGKGKKEIEISRHRLIITASLFLLCFVALVGRLIDLAFLGSGDGNALIAAQQSPAPVHRAEIVDRNGLLLAANLQTASVYAHPKQILDPYAAATELVSVLPELDWDDTVRKLSSSRSFVWLKRHLTPRQHAEVNALGIPGVMFVEEARRVYPHGALASHVTGFVDIDNEGLAGMERYFDHYLKRDYAHDNPFVTTLDIRVQHALRDELMSAMANHNAVGAAGIVMDVATGEILAMVSLPDFDPNNPAAAADDAKFNRASLGVYEMGSIFKTFNVALALDDRVVELSDGYDATDPIRAARFVIEDDHPEARWLSIPEIYIYSSNIGSAKLALDVGIDRQRHFLDRLGFLHRASVELPEVGTPIYPSRWREINAMTISFGHGIAITPLQTASGIASIVNGGIYHAPTLLPPENRRNRHSYRIIDSETSKTMRALMRLVVEKGTGSKAEAKGYYIGGKTGTAEKSVGGTYDKKSLLSSFVGVFPIDDPRYVVFAMLDEPEGTKDTFGFAAGGWTAAPVVRRTVERIGPLLGVKPRLDLPDDNPLTLIAAKR